VLGDFDNARVSHGKVSAHFQRQGQSFYVSTQGVGGQLSRFEVRYTFGFSPLQQYLIAFPGGRLQTLPWAWDTEKNRWFYVPEEIPAPDDWLYWTNGAMNWNSMYAPNGICPEFPPPTRWMVGAFRSVKCRPSSSKKSRNLRSTCSNSTANLKPPVQKTPNSRHGWPNSNRHGTKRRTACQQDYCYCEARSSRSLC